MTSQPAVGRLTYHKKSTMALIATLEFGDNEIRRYSKQYLLADFRCHLVRHHNEARPDGNPRCEHMELTVIAPGRADLNLFEWYVGSYTMNGRVLVSIPDSSPNQDEMVKAVYFENAVCYSIAEEYHIDESKRRTLKLQIVATAVTVDDIELKTQS